jgi:hypothetical protein
VIHTDGFTIFEADACVARWAHAARAVAREVAQRPQMRGPDNLRHQQTWFVGVDALPNGRDGSMGGTPLKGPWEAHVPELPLHPAQLSIIYAGYPKQDAGESDANHRFRLNRAAAHVDGLLPVGPDKRRFALEYHAYILALPLTEVAASPTVVWRGSHHIMQRALRDAIAGRDPAQVDITEPYKAARRDVFETCTPVPLKIIAGQSALVHRFALHGTQPWDGAQDPSGEGRMVAFFRPECAGGAEEWLALP